MKGKSVSGVPGRIDLLPDALPSEQVERPTKGQWAGNDLLKISRRICPNPLVECE